MTLVILFCVYAQDHQIKGIMLVDKKKVYFGYVVISFSYIK